MVGAGPGGRHQGLGALTWALVTTHALAYGGVTILGVDLEAPDLDR